MNVYQQASPTLNLTRHSAELLVFTELNTSVTWAQGYALSCRVYMTFSELTGIRGSPLREGKKSVLPGIVVKTKDENRLWTSCRQPTVYFFRLSASFSLQLFCDSALAYPLFFTKCLCSLCPVLTRGRKPSWIAWELKRRFPGTVSAELLKLNSCDDFLHRNGNKRQRLLTQATGSEFVMIDSINVIINHDGQRIGDGVRNAMREKGVLILMSFRLSQLFVIEKIYKK